MSQGDGEDGEPDLTDVLNAKAPSLRPSDAVAAIIVVPGQGYLMQQRDPIPNIFYPGHWGLFGGASEEGEDEITTLKRELHEELALSPEHIAPERFLNFRFQFEFDEGALVNRLFYTFEIAPETVPKLRLAEGAGMAVLNWRDALDPNRPVTPYDSFALWIHHNRDRLSLDHLRHMGAEIQ
jgi:8-oxo-dGTP pyrophosphatase MutT (NUDIX family)